MVLPLLPFRELLVLVALLAAVAAVYVAAAWAVVGCLHRRFVTGTPAPRKGKWRRRGVVLAAVAGLFCLAYAHFVEPCWLAVRRVRITSAKLPPSCRPVRIVHVSDLHSDANPRLERRLPVAVAALNPDLIAFTGDAANSAPGLEHFRQCVSRLVLIAPTYAVRGNWDGAAESTPLFADTGATELNGQAVTVNVAGAEVWISGLPAWSEDRIESVMKGRPPGVFCLFLYHYPDAIHQLSRCKVDLCLSGHTHGGQVALPFYGAVVTLSRFGKQFEGGLYRAGDTWLHVSRGIGMEGGLAPRLRFLARPEVTLIEVCPENSETR